MKVRETVYNVKTVRLMRRSQGNGFWLEFEFENELVRVWFEKLEEG